jgi:hypothetical protein
MSAILFNNPFAAPPPAASLGQTATTGLALAAIPATGGASLAKDATLSGGNGSGSELSKQAETVALFNKKQSLERPPSATGRSVVNAQAQPGLPQDNNRLGPDLPEVDMPDPLPTSPFLLQLRQAG